MTLGVRYFLQYTPVSLLLTTCDHIRLDNTSVGMPNWIISLKNSFWLLITFTHTLGLICSEYSQLKCGNEALQETPIHLRDGNLVGHFGRISDCVYFVEHILTLSTIRLNTVE